MLSISLNFFLQKTHNVYLVGPNEVRYNRLSVGLLWAPDIPCSHYYWDGLDLDLDTSLRRAVLGQSGCWSSRWSVSFTVVNPSISPGSRLLDHVGTRVLGRLGSRLFDLPWLYVHVGSFDLDFLSFSFAPGSFGGWPVGGAGARPPFHPNFLPFFHKFSVMASWRDGKFSWSISAAFSSSN